MITLNIGTRQPCCLLVVKTVRKQSMESSLIIEQFIDQLLLSQKTKQANENELEE